MKVSKRQRKKMRQEQVCKLADGWRREKISRSFTATFENGPALYLAQVEPDAIEIHIVPRLCGCLMKGSRLPFFNMAGRHLLKGNEFQIGNRCFLIKEEAGRYSLFQNYPRLRAVSGFRPLDETDPDWKLLRIDSVLARVVE